MCSACVSHIRRERQSQRKSAPAFLGAGMILKVHTVVVVRLVQPWIYHYTTIPLYHYTTIPLYHYTTIPLYHYTTIPLYHYTTIPLYHYTTIPLYHYTTIPLYHYTTIPLYHYTTIPLYHYTNIVIVTVSLHYGLTIICFTFSMPVLKQLLTR